MPQLLSSYRTQLNTGFDLDRLRALVPYLARLGVAFVYTSPVLRARKGSAHGYDVVDPAGVNPELGDEKAWACLHATLRQRDMGHLLDIVPNHMAVGAENPYWEDVLRRGQRSRYAHWFDVDWIPTARVTVPILEEDIDEALARERIGLVRAGEEVRLTYGPASLPLDPDTLGGLPADLDAWRSGAEGRERLRALIERQHYRLITWRRAAREINYRRFFDVNEMAGLRMEDPAVFDAVHEAILAWIEQGDVHGLRVDHIDGLRGPLAYLRRLRGEVDARAGSAIPIVVEKILGCDESLRTEWPVDGTTGYEFLSALDAIFVLPEGFAAIRAGYERLSRLPGVEDGFPSVAWRAKRAILRDALRADVRRLARVARPIVRATRPDLASQSGVVLALEHLIAALPVYRTYIDAAGEASDEDRSVIRRAVERATREPTCPVDLVRLLADVLLGEAMGDLARREHQRRATFLERFQQLSAPVMAKGVEDTALYQYVPLVSLNEVGCTPDQPLRDAVTRLHEDNATRAARWPRSLLCTNTHDTKRSADVRARLNVLSEMPREWLLAVARWRRANRRWKGRAGRRVVPDTNTEYLLYQTIVGLWPLPSAGTASGAIPERDTLAALRDRISRYMLKAVREGKQRSRWTDADAAYERALRSFVAAVLDAGTAGAWLRDVAEFMAGVQRPGMWNALSRVAVHLTAPGVPDLYQGDELWNFALVDPDNRAPVDFGARVEMLEGLDADLDASGVLPERRAMDLVRAPEDGRIKLYLTARLLRVRRRLPELFARGAYAALPGRGAAADHLVAFRRHTASGDHALTVATRLAHTLMKGPEAPVGDVWGDTSVPLPPGSPMAWRCALTGRRLVAHTGESGAQELRARDVLGSLPVAVLIAGENS